MSEECRLTIDRLGLAVHPEGGHYRRTFESSFSMGQSRPTMTAILYLLQRGEMSCLHRIQSDELWFFHSGAPLSIVTFDPLAATCHTTTLFAGPSTEAMHAPQHVVLAGKWFGAAVDPSEGADYTLVSCAVSPGFTFTEWELATPSLLEDPSFLALSMDEQTHLHNFIKKTPN